MNETNVPSKDIDFNRLEVSVFSGTEDLGPCDFREDGLDPFGVDNFIRNKASAYQHYKLCVIYFITCDGATLGFFTVSMGVIDVCIFPGLFLGNMGVDKRYRNKGLGHGLVK